MPSSQSRPSVCYSATQKCLKMLTFVPFSLQKICIQRKKNTSETGQNTGENVFRLEVFVFQILFASWIHLKNKIRGRIELFRPLSQVLGFPHIFWAEVVISTPVTHFSFSRLKKNFSLAEPRLFLSNGTAVAALRFDLNANSSLCRKVWSLSVVLHFPSLPIEEKSFMHGRSYWKTVPGRDCLYQPAFYPVRVPSINLPEIYNKKRIKSLN